MSDSHLSHQHLARAGAPTSGLVHTMSTSSTTPAAVKPTTTARVVSSSTKVQVTSTSPVVAKPSTSSQVRAATSSSVAPVKPTTSTAPVLKTITPETTSSARALPSTTSTTSTSSTPTTSSTPKTTSTSTSTRISTSTTSSSSSSISSLSSPKTSSSSSTIDILASASASPSSATTKSTSGISGGAVAGIIIGVLIALLGAALVAYRLIQRRRRANRRLTGNLQAWTDRTSYFSASGAGRRGEREVEGGQVPFRDLGDKDGDGGPWGMEEKAYQEPVLAGVGAGVAAGVGTGVAYGQHDQHQQAYQAYEHQQAYPSQYQQSQQQGYQSDYQQPEQYYQAYPQQQPFDHSLMPLTPTHQTQPQGYPYTPSASAQSPETYNAMASPVPSSAAVPAQVMPSGPTLQDGMTVIVRQGFVRTLEDELVIAPGDTLTVVQAYDDGWCLCQSALNEQGVVPQSCLEPVSPFAEQGRTSPIQMPVPAVMVSDGNDEVLAGEEEKTLPSLPRSDTRKSLAVSERSERRSSLFLNAAAAGLFLQQQAAMQAPQ